MGSARRRSLAEVRDWKGKSVFLPLVDEVLMIKRKRIFITGGAGFIANKVIASLIGENHITIYDNFTRDTLRYNGFHGHKNIHVIKGDVFNYNFLCRSMKGADIVIHAAAIAGIDTVIKRPTQTMRVNMMGTANVLEAAKQHRIRGRVIDFSTSEVFGSMAYKSCEGDNTVAGTAGEARWTYAVSKLAGEHLAMAYHKEYGLPVVSVRPFNVYGPGQTGEGAILIFIRNALKNENIYIYGDGSRIRAWCYVDDFVEGLLRCLEHPKAVGQSFNIGNPRAVVTVYGLAQIICRVLFSRSKILFKPDLSADIDMRVPSVDKARKILGYRASVDLEEGIKKTAEWITRNGSN
jgi:UDP-glucose 4-epimerase